MNKVRLLTTAAALLAIGIAPAFAQAPEKQAPARAPAAQQSAPPDKIAPPMNAGQARPADPAAKPETTGQAPAPGPRTHDMKDMKPGAAPTAQPPQRSDSKVEDNKANDSKADATVKPGTTQANDAKPSPSTTGQGAGRGAATLSTEQRSKITTVIRQQKVQPVNVNINVSVGTRITQSVRYYPLPVDVVTIYPQWRGYDYIIVGSAIVVVDPATREIVAVLDV